MWMTFDGYRTVNYTFGTWVPKLNAKGRCDNTLAFFDAYQFWNLGSHRTYRT